MERGLATDLENAKLANESNLMQLRIWNQNFLHSTSSLPANSHSSYEPLEKLCPITFSQMQTPALYEKRFLACRLLAHVDIRKAALFCEDNTGAVALVAFVNFVPALFTFDLILEIPAGKIMFIKEPTTVLKGNGPPFVRVDSPSDIIFVRESDSDLLRHAGALGWHRPEALSFDELKEQGNQMFTRHDYNAALDFYERALAISPSSATAAIIHLNMAAALLQLGKFYEANEHATKALEMGANREKAFFRLGKAAYGMRFWHKAVDHFQQALAENPRNGLTVEELKKVKARLLESQTGEYDLKMLYDQSSTGEIEQQFDVADYIGPVKVVDIQGKGKGLVVTENVPKGTLLLVSKAYARCEERIGDMGAGVMVRQAIDCVQQLKLNPQTSDQFYALYAGEKFMDRRDQLPPPGVLDIDRIVRTNAVNNFEDASPVGTRPNAESNNSIGLWLLPSFINHSCIPTAIRVQFGNVLFVRALVDLAKGEEITLSYTFINNSFKERTQALEARGFQCHCQMCEADRADPAGDEEREKIYQEARSIKSKVLQNPKNQSFVRNQIDALNALVSRIDLSYDVAKRPKHLRLQLSFVLFTLCEVYSELGDMKMASQTHAQIGQFVCMPIGNFWMGMEFYKSSFTYSLLSKQQQKTKNAAEAAFEYANLYAGIKQKALFKHIYTEFAPYL